MPASNAPLTISYHSDGNAWTFEAMDELLASFDWFDSDDPARARVCRGCARRLIRLKLENGQLLAFDLAAGRADLTVE